MIGFAKSRKHWLPARKQNRMRDPVFLKTCKYIITLMINQFICLFISKKRLQVLQSLKTIFLMLREYRFQVAVHGANRFGALGEQRFFIVVERNVDDLFKAVPAYNAGNTHADVALSVFAFEVH